MRILDIKEGTSVDGIGLRTSIYFSGCKHHCKGCHNPQSWEYGNGDIMTEDEVMEVIKRNGFNVTFSGGDPLYQYREVVHLAKRIKEELGLNIWCYTGYLFDRVKDDFPDVLPFIDVLVDGHFKLKLRDTSLLFRGSSNQRIIDVQKSITTNNIVLWEN